MALQKRVVVSRMEPAFFFRPEIVPPFSRRTGGSARLRGTRVRNLRSRRSARGRGLPLPPRRGEGLRFDVRGSVIHRAPECRAPRFEPERHVGGSPHRRGEPALFPATVRKRDPTHGELSTSPGAVMFDIDEFKKINDTHGHHAGDVVIKKMAGIVKKYTRGSDLVGRYGGDEFILLITSTTEEQAVSFVEKITEKISATEIAIPGRKSPCGSPSAVALPCSHPRAVHHRTVQGGRRCPVRIEAAREETGS